MKAKEFALQYNAAEDKVEALGQILDAFLLEAKTIALARKLSSNAAACALLNEQDQKWQAFARIVGDGVRPDGFARAIEHFMPDVYRVWQNLKVRRR